MTSLHVSGGVDVAGRPLDLHIEDGIISERSGPGTAVLDASGCTVVPGFVDLQVNGAFGVDFTASPAGIWAVGARLPVHGVASFLPTLVSASPEIVDEALGVLAAGPPAGWAGAHPLGLHCEGPMISPARRGAHREAALRLPSRALIAGWTRSAGVVMVTIAPELDGAIEVIGALVAENVVVAVGHSDADVDTTLSAFESGAGHATHLFNAMSGLDHRSPGVAAAALTASGVTAGIIPDGVHVHPSMLRLAMRAKGAGLVVVTDSMSATGLGDGVFSLSGIEIEVGNGVARTDDGRLAGSTLTMDEAVRRFVRLSGAGLGEAVSAATDAPARAISDGERGNLRPGSRGDLAVLDDRLDVRATVVGGRVVFSDR